jgi:hypothetical protein
MLCEESINIKLICGQEGHTGVVELKPASHDDEAVAEDDPEAVRLMIDFSISATTIQTSSRNIRPRVQQMRTTRPSIQVAVSSRRL